MIRPFLASWVGYFALLALSPLVLLYPDWQQALLLQFAFIALVLAGDRLVRIVTPSAMFTSPAEPVSAARCLAWIAVGLSIIGVLCFAFDKLFIQDIDYAQGLGSAREQWRVLREGKSGPSSLFSAAGHLLGNAYFAAVILVCGQYSQFRHRERMQILIISAVVALIMSFLTGGRSSLLLLVGFAVVSPFIRKGGRLGEVMPLTWQRVLIVSVCLLMSVYIVFVFGERAAASYVPLTTYVQRGLLSLGFELSPTYHYVLNQSPVAPAAAGILFSVAYLTHSFATVAAMMDVPPDDQLVLFSYGLRLLARAGLIVMPGDDWFLAGRFPSLPGGLWYQLGIWGFASVSLALGALSALGELWSARFPKAIIPATFQASIGLTLLLSPLLFAGDLMAFPFAIFGFIVLAGLQPMISATNLWSWRMSWCRQRRIDRRRH